MRLDKNREWIKERFLHKPYYCRAELKFILVTDNLNHIFLILKYIWNGLWWKKILQKKSFYIVCKNPVRKYPAGTVRTMYVQLVQCTYIVRTVPAGYKTM